MSLVQGHNTCGMCHACAQQCTRTHTRCLKREGCDRDELAAGGVPDAIDLAEGYVVR